MAEMRLANQVAVVTGASRGIGRAIAHLLATEGARVVLAARGAEALEAVVQEVEAQEGKAIALPADVSHPTEAKRLIDLVLTRYGKVDILVNNAGVGSSSKLVAEMDDESWRRVLDGNLNSTFFCCRAALPAMIEAGYGRIVNISSRVGLAGYVLGSEPGTSAHADYAAAKAGVVALTKAIAWEAAPHGITVNVITPGPIRTAMLTRAGEVKVASLDKLVPVGRIGEPQEIAEAVLFLARPDSSFITGEVLNVNGGAWMG